jgi:hypothetical protein
MALYSPQVNFPMSDREVAFRQRKLFETNPLGAVQPMKRGVDYWKPEQAGEDLQPDVSKMSPQELYEYSSYVTGRQKVDEAVSRHGGQVKQTLPPVSTIERARYVQDHPLGGAFQEDQLKSLKSVSELQDYMKTPQGLQVFGPDTSVGAAPVSQQQGLAALGNLNPDALASFNAERDKQRRDEGDQAYFYRTKIDPNTALTPAEMAAEVRKNPTLLSQFNAMTPEERTQNAQSRSLAFQTQLQSEIDARGKEASQWTSKDQVDAYQAQLEAGGVPYVDAKSMAKAVVESANPELAQNIENQKLLTNYLPLPAKARRMRVPSGKDDAGNPTFATAEDYENLLRRNLAEAMKKKGPAAQAAIIKADAELGQLYGEVSQRLKQVDSVIKWGAAKDVVQLMASGETNTIKQAARNALVQGVGEQNKGLIYNDNVQSAKPDLSGVIPENAVQESKTDGGLVKINGKVADIPKLIVSQVKDVLADMKGSLAGNAFSDADIAEAIADSTRKVLADASANQGFRIIGKRPGEKYAGEEYAAQLAKDVLSEYDKQAGEAFKGYDQANSQKLVPIINKFLDQSKSVARWDDNASMTALKAVNGYLDANPSLLIDLDLDHSKSIDTPEEFAMAYMVMNNGKDAKQLADKLVANKLSVPGTQMDAGEVTAAFGDLGEKLHKASAVKTREDSLKVEDEWKKATTDIRSILEAGTRLISSLPENMRSQKFVTDAVPYVNPKNPAANLIERGEKEKIWYATPELAAVARTLDNDGLNAFNNTIGSRDGVFGLSNDINTRRGIVAAMSGRTQDLTGGDGSQYSEEWGAELNAAGIANATEAANKRIKEGEAGIKKMEIVYPESLKDVYDNNPKIKALYDLGVLRRGLGQDTSGKLMDLANVMATETYRAMESAVMDAGVREIQQNMLQTSTDTAYKLADAIEGFDLAEEGQPGYGKVRSPADIAHRVSRMIYNDEFTESELVELRGRFEKQAKIASESQGDRTKQKLNFGGFVSNKTLEGYGSMAEEIVKAVDDKTSVGRLKATDVIHEENYAMLEDAVLRAAFPTGFAGMSISETGVPVRVRVNATPWGGVVRRELKESGILRNSMYGASVGAMVDLLKVGRGVKEAALEVGGFTKDSWESFLDEIKTATKSGKGAK